MKRSLILDNCKNCPNCDVKLTKGHGYAQDYFCKLTGKVIAGYVEWASEEPQNGEIPEWCPLPMHLEAVGAVTCE